MLFSTRKRRAVGVTLGGEKRPDELEQLKEPADSMTMKAKPGTIRVVRWLCETWAEVEYLQRRQIELQMDARSLRVPWEISSAEALDAIYALPAREPHHDCWRLNAATPIADCGLLNHALSSHGRSAAGFTRKQASSQARSECRAPPAMPTQPPGSRRRHGASRFSSN